MRSAPPGAYNRRRMLKVPLRRLLFVALLVAQAAPAFASGSRAPGAALLRPGSAEAPAVASSPEPERPLLFVVPVDRTLPAIRGYSTPAIPERHIGVSLIPQRIFSKYFSYRESLSAP